MFTAFIKNSTKRVDDQIFITKENIRGLKKDFENIKLEHNYLTSAEKLLEYQDHYFYDELIKKDLQNIKTINATEKKIKIKQLKIINEQ
jgi:gluconate kinase